MDPLSLTLLGGALGWLLWRTSPGGKRYAVVAAARKEIGKSDASVYWREVLPPGVAYPQHWCGAFALAMLHRARLNDWPWEVGKGFLYRLPRTASPQPGDVAYFDQPYQHHAIVERVLPDGTLQTIDGNQPDVRRKVRSLKSATAYYSIAPLL